MNINSDSSKYSMFYKYCNVNISVFSTADKENVATNLFDFDFLVNLTRVDICRTVLISYKQFHLKQKHFGQAV